MKLTGKIVSRFKSFENYGKLCPSNILRLRFWNSTQKSIFKVQKEKRIGGFETAPIYNRLVFRQKRYCEKKEAVRQVTRGS